MAKKTEIAKKKKLPKVDMSNCNIAPGDAFMVVTLAMLQEHFMSSDCKLFILERSLSMLDELGYSTEDIDFFRDKLIDEVNKISKKSGVPTDKITIKHSEKDEELFVSYKLQWSDIKLDKLARLEYDRMVNQYKQDYDTMLRVQNTKKLADVKKNIHSSIINRRL